MGGNLMLRSAENAASTPRGFTPREVARLFRVSVEKVRGWIARGELAAINTADSPVGKPRYVVTPAALERFEAGRHAATEPKPAPRRRRRLAGMIDYFPD